MKTVTVIDSVFIGGTFEVIREGEKAVFVRDSNGDKFWLKKRILQEYQTLPFPAAMNRGSTIWTTDRGAVMGNTEACPAISVSVEQMNDHGFLILAFHHCTVEEWLTGIQEFTL